MFLYVSGIYLTLEEVESLTIRSVQAPIVIVYRC